MCAIFNVKVKILKAPIYFKNGRVRRYFAQNWAKTKVRSGDSGTFHFKMQLVHGDSVTGACALGLHLLLRRNHIHYPVHFFTDSINFRHK